MKDEIRDALERIRQRYNRGEIDIDDLWEMFAREFQHNEMLHRRIEMLEGWKSSVLDTNARRAMLEVLPPLHIHKDPGRLPEDYQEEMFVPIAHYNTAKNEANLALSAVEILQEELRTLRKLLDSLNSPNRV